MIFFIGYLVGLALASITIGLEAFDDLGARDALLVIILYPIILIIMILNFLYAIITNKKLDEADITDIFKH